VVNVFKIRRSAGAAPAGVQTTIGGVTIRGAPTMGSQSSGCIAAFFAFHYGLFWVVHGVFVFVLFAGASLDGRGILVALMGLSAYHVVEYWYGFVGKGEYRRVSPAAQMARPYGRVFVLHLTIVFGAILVVVLGRPIVLVALLATLKTAIDVGLYAFARSGRRTAGVRT
jgi:hypothetical protein